MSLKLELDAQGVAQSYPMHGLSRKCSKATNAGNQRSAGARVENSSVFLMQGLEVI